MKKIHIHVCTSLRQIMKFRFVVMYYTSQILSYITCINEISKYVLVTKSCPCPFNVESDFCMILWKLISGYNLIQSVQWCVYVSLVWTRPWWAVGNYMDSPARWQVEMSLLSNILLLLRVSILRSEHLLTLHVNFDKSTFLHSGWEKNNYFNEPRMWGCEYMYILTQDINAKQCLDRDKSVGNRNIQVYRTLRLVQ